MKPELLLEMWEELNLKAQREIRNLVKYPTERNSCYVTGYFGALYDNGLMFRNTYTYWLAAIGPIENEPAVREAVLNLTKGE